MIGKFHANLRLAAACILRSHDEALTIMGFVCSSFVGVNLGTSCRTVLNPEGDESVPSVKSGNMMLGRFLGSIDDFNLWSIFFSNIHEAKLREMILV